VHGIEGGLMMQHHQSGVPCNADFTLVKGRLITTAGVVLAARLFQLLPNQFGLVEVEVIHGGVTIVALAEELQNVLEACAGKPTEHRG